METVLFSFVGICTHIGEALLTPPHDAFKDAPGIAGPSTRVVLPDASLGCRWNHQHIPAHDAVLYIEKRLIKATSDELRGLEEIDRELCTWRLRGVHLCVTDAVTHRIDTRPSYHGLPSLAKIADTNVELDPASSIKAAPPRSSISTAACATPTATRTTAKRATASSPSKPPRSTWPSPACATTPPASSNCKTRRKAK